jgi:hypothetical protein
MENDKKCRLCSCKLIEKNPPNHGQKWLECHISRHHLFPKRLTKYFKDEKEIKEFFKIDPKNPTITLCYQCHEEVLHNIVFSPAILEKLNKKMRNKDIKDRIKILYKQLLK